MSSIYETNFKAKTNIVKNKNDFFNLLNSLNVNIENIKTETSKFETRFNNLKKRVKEYKNRPEVKKRIAENAKIRYRNMTPKQKEIFLKKSRKVQRKRYKNLTAEQKEKLKIYKKNWVKNLSEEHKKAILERRRKRYQEQKDKILARERERYKNMPLEEKKEHNKRKWQRQKLNKLKKQNLASS